MPVYEYECPECRKVYELWQSMYDIDARTCPECSRPMHKLISKSSFQLRGGGWCADGYCKKKETNTSEKTPVNTAGCCRTGDNEKPSCAACN